MVKPHSPISEARVTPPLLDGRKIALGVHGQGVGAYVLSTLQRPTLGWEKDSVSPRQDFPRQKRVVFSRKVMVKQSLHFKDMNDETRFLYWMTDFEHAEIKDHCKCTVQKMMRGDDDVDKEFSDFCSRGLESRTRQGMKEKKHRKDELRRAVLIQDQLQKEEGTFDPEFLALISVSKSRESQDIALERASQDAKEAWQYLHEKRGE